MKHSQKDENRMLMQEVVEKKTQRKSGLRLFNSRRLLGDIIYV